MFFAPPAPTSAPSPPVTLPQKCVGYVASWSGDPHMRTFDALKYDCQGEGEFHVLKSLNSTFELQGRFVKFRPKSRPTITQSVAFETGDGEPRIQVNVPQTSENGCTPYVYVNGILRNVVADGVGDESVQVQSLVTKNYVGLVFYYHGSKVQLTTMAKKSSKNGCVLAAKICLPYDYKRSEETFVGLLGSPNKDKSDDWMTRDGGLVAIPETRHGLRFAPAYNWCTRNWCIRDVTKSMFVYENGQSFAGFNQCDQAPDKNTQACVDNPPEHLKEICGSDNMECMIDGCIGDEEDARKLAEADEDLTDKKCGRQVFFEDFDKPCDGAWGEIAKNDDRETKFLRLHKGSPTFRRNFKVPLNSDMITLEFMLYEIGAWERKGSGADGQDSIFVYIGKTKLDLQGFDSSFQEGNPDEFYHGMKRGISWQRRSVTNTGDFGFGGGNDQMHKVIVKIPPEYYTNGKLRIGMKVVMRGKISDESAGIDDFRLVAYGKSCDIPGETPEGMPAPPRVTDVPESLPVQCDERVAIFWGDPHIVTFDGVKYDCQGEGEFTLIKSLDGDGGSKFEIQGRFVRFQSNRRVTVTRGVAIKDEGVPTVQIDVPDSYDKQCPIDLYVGGEKRSIYDGSGVDSVIVNKIGQAVVIYYPKSGVQTVSLLKKSNKYGCFFSTKVCLPDDYREGEKLVGLLGSPDGNDRNEWMDSNGDEVAFTGSRRYRGAYEYCTQFWCIRDAKKSLFQYDAGESFARFQNCGKSYETSTEECAKNPPKELEDICGEDETCIIDGCAGDDTDARIAVDIEVDLNEEKGCGEQILFEDFDENDVTEWGIIETDQRSGQSFLGRFHRGSDPVVKEYDVPAFAKRVTVEFLLYEIDDWGAKNRNRNKFFVIVGGSKRTRKFDLKAFVDEDSMFHPGNTKSGVSGGIRWSRQATMTAVHMGFNEKYKDQIHKVVIDIPKKYFTGGKLKLGFDVELMAEIEEVSAGVDDLRITAKGKCAAAKQANKKKPKTQKRKKAKTVTKVKKVVKKTEAKSAPKKEKKVVRNRQRVEKKTVTRTRAAVSSKSSKKKVVVMKKVKKVKKTKKPAKKKVVKKKVTTKTKKTKKTKPKKTAEKTVVRNRKKKEKMRRALLDVAALDAPSNAYRELAGEACSCICPEDESQSVGSAVALSAKSLDLYAATNSDCGPEGPKVGAVHIVPNSNGTVTVTYAMERGFVMEETNLHLGSALLPSTLAAFPYKNEVGALTSKSYNIPMEKCDFFVAAHATVCGTRNAFEAAAAAVRPLTTTSRESLTRTRGKVAATGGSPTTTVSGGVVDSAAAMGCETAFAFDPVSGKCFDQFKWPVAKGGKDDDIERWGWSIGPLEPRSDSYDFQIYAAAGQCDLTKGTLVGSLSVVYNGPVAQATYNMDPGFTMKKTHLNIDNLPLPTNNKGEITVAPGQYTAIHDPLNHTDSDKFSIAHLSGEVYVVAHAEVCGGSGRRLDLGDEYQSDDEEYELEEEEYDLDEDYEEESDDEHADEVSAEGADGSPVECRPAFAYHSARVSSSFKDLGFTENIVYEDSDITWGWSNGPLGTSNYAYSFDLYAGDGIVAGTMSVDYNGEEAVVTVDAGDRLWLKETHAYVGTVRLPTDEETGAESVDPMHYPIVHKRMSMSRTFTITELNDQPVYVVAHATVCGIFPTSASEGEAPPSARIGGTRGGEKDGDGNWASYMKKKLF